MTPNLVNALLITAIGMGLVFLVILLLWGLMALVVALTADRRAPTVEVVEAQEPTQKIDVGRHCQAAAAAVAVALARRQAAVRLALPAAGKSGAGLTPWQAAHRMSLIRNRQRGTGR